MVLSLRAILLFIDFQAAPTVGWIGPTRRDPLSSEPSFTTCNVLPRVDVRFPHVIAVVQNKPTKAEWTEIVRNVLPVPARCIVHLMLNPNMRIFLVSVPPIPSGSMYVSLSESMQMVDGFPV